MCLCFDFKHRPQSSFDSCSQQNSHFQSTGVEEAGWRQPGLEGGVGCVCVEELIEEGLGGGGRGVLDFYYCENKMR